MFKLIYRSLYGEIGTVWYVNCILLIIAISLGLKYNLYDYVREGYVQYVVKPLLGKSYYTITSDEKIRDKAKLKYIIHTSNFSLKSYCLNLIFIFLFELLLLLRLFIIKYIYLYLFLQYILTLLLISNTWLITASLISIVTILSRLSFHLTDFTMPIFYLTTTQLQNYSSENQIEPTYQNAKILSLWAVRSVQNRENFYSKAQLKPRRFETPYLPIYRSYSIMEIQKHFNATLNQMKNKPKNINKIIIRTFLNHLNEPVIADQVGRTIANININLLTTSKKINIKFQLLIIVYICFLLYTSLSPLIELPISVDPITITCGINALPTIFKNKLATINENVKYISKKFVNTPIFTPNVSSKHATSVKTSNDFLASIQQKPNLPTLTNTTHANFYAYNSTDKLLYIFTRSTITRHESNGLSKKFDRNQPLFDFKKRGVCTVVKILKVSDNPKEIDNVNIIDEQALTSSFLSFLNSGLLVCVEPESTYDELIKSTAWSFIKFAELADLKKKNEDLSYSLDSLKTMLTQKAEFSICQPIFITNLLFEPLSNNLSKNDTIELVNVLVAYNSSILARYEIPDNIKFWYARKYLETVITTLDNKLLSDKEISIFPENSALDSRFAYNLKYLQDYISILIKNPNQHYLSVLEPFEVNRIRPIAAYSKYHNLPDKDILALTETVTNRHNINIGKNDTFGCSNFFGKNNIYDHSKAINSLTSNVSKNILTNNLPFNDDSQSSFLTTPIPLSSISKSNFEDID